MKIKMNHTVCLLNYGKTHTFHKGRIYNAVDATNQPDWQFRGKVFVNKAKTPDCSMLLYREDYTKV